MLKYYRNEESVVDEKHREEEAELRVPENIDELHKAMKKPRDVSS